MTLELTTTFRNISTAGGRAPSDAAASACAHLRYIDRGPAVEFRATSNIAGADLKAQRADLRQAFRQIAEKGGKRGSRVAEKFVISLPNSWSADDRAEILRRLVEHIAPPDSDAKAWGVVHKDRPENRHIHIVAIDGAESRQDAVARKEAGDWRRHPERTQSADEAVLGATRPPRTRIVRRNVIRLGDKTRAKEVRSEIAGVINQLAAERGLERVEHRSFAERGLEGPAMVKEGHTVRQGHDPAGRAAYNERIRGMRRREAAEVEEFLGKGMVADDIDDLFGDERDASQGPPPGWIPPDDKDADVEFDRREARRMRLEAAQERARQAEQAEKMKKRPPKRRGGRGQRVR